MPSKRPDEIHLPDVFTPREVRLITAALRDQQAVAATEMQDSNPDLAARVMAERKHSEIEHLVRKVHRIAERASEALDTVWVYRDASGDWSWRRVASTGLETAHSSTPTPSKAWCWYFAHFLNGGAFIVREQEDTSVPVD